ncbi:hypothetical protein M1D93_10480 [Arthrobacter sp. Z1-9]
MDEEIAADTGALTSAGDRAITGHRYRSTAPPLPGTQLTGTRSTGTLATTGDAAPRRRRQHQARTAALKRAHFKQSVA